MLLFICILQKPNDANVNTRFGAINDAINFVSQIMTTQQDSFLRPIVAVCHELARIARLAIQKASMRTDRLDHPQMTTSQATNHGSTTMNPDTGQCPISGASNPSVAPEHDGLSSIVDDYAYHLPFDHNESGSAIPQAQGLDLGAFSVDQLYDLPLPFSWNWHDLSAGLLEDFDFV